jgi:hypothetical protein
MSKPQDRHITQRPDGTWANKAQGNTRATSIHETQQQAANAARANLHNQGGGELNIHGQNGQIRAKDTISPGRDSFPPRG